MQARPQETDGSKESIDRAHNVDQEETRKKKPSRAYTSAAPPFVVQADTKEDESVISALHCWTTLLHRQSRAHCQAQESTKVFVATPDSITTLYALCCYAQSQISAAFGVSSRELSRKS